MLQHYIIMLLMNRPSLLGGRKYARVKCTSGIFKLFMQVAIYLYLQFNNGDLSHF